MLNDGDYTNSFVLLSSKVNKSITSYHIKLFNPKSDEIPVNSYFMKLQLNHMVHENLIGQYTVVRLKDHLYQTCRVSL